MSAPPELASPTTQPDHPPQSSPAVPDRPWRRAWRTGAIVWGAAATAYFLVNCLVWMVRSEAGPRVSGMLEVWDRWDTGHYVTIAMSGYGDSGSQSTAFFPLYPLLIRALEPVLPGGALSAGLIIAHAACLVALVLLVRLAEDLFGPRVARRSAFYLMAYPFGFFLVTAYNESLFLALTVGALYCMRRGLWWHAGALGALASATRLAGVLLGLAFVVEYLRQHHPISLRRLRPYAASIMLIPLGVVAYALYCWHRYGDPLQFMTIQATWGRKLSLPWHGLERAIAVSVDASRDGAVFQPVVMLNLIDILALVSSLVLLILSAVGPWRLGRESAYLVVFGFASLAIAVISPLGNEVPLHGLPRYALELVPMFLVLARMGAAEAFDRFYVSIAWALQSALLLAFFFGLWLS